MPALDNLMRYVRSGTTEGDLQFLVDTFVSPSQLADVCGIEPGSMRVLLGNKGAGKSAIAEWLKKQSIRAKVPCVLLRPDQLVDTGAPAALDLSTLKAYYFDKLLRSVSAEIGKQVRSYIPLIGDSAKLYNEARSAGLSKEDLVTKSLGLLSAISKPANGIDGVQFAKDLAGKNSHESLVRAVNSHLLPFASKVFLLLIDDTDQLARPDEPDQLNRIWALLLATRRITMECPSVRPILTLRSSVWSRLMHESAGQRDQVDHIRPLVVSLSASDELISEIVERRLWKAARDSEVKVNSAFEPFFEDVSVALPLSKERRPWQTFIAKSARERPRDALQLIKNMIDAAKKQQHQRIGDADAADAMHIYSAERVDDVTNEYSLDCPMIREILNSFQSVDFELDFEELRQHLHTLGGMGALWLRGKQVHPANDGDAIKVLRLLHEVGFINPRIPDATMTRHFRHVNFSEDPIFVRETNWNGLQAAKWEVHPAFRDHLLSLKKAKDLRRLS